jgi:Deoxyribonuclease NucA/NucB
VKHTKALALLAATVMAGSALSSTGSADASPIRDGISLEISGPGGTTPAPPPYHRRTIAEIERSKEQHGYVVNMNQLRPQTPHPKSSGGPIDDCRKMQVHDYRKGEVMSHFSYCDKFHEKILYHKGINIVGVQQFDAILVGFGWSGARQVDFTLQLENFSKSGDVHLAPDPLLNMTMYCFPGLGDIGGCDKSVPGDLTTHRLISGWKVSPQAYFSLKSASTNGVGKEKVNISGWQLIAEALQVPIGLSDTIVQSSVRFDSASYLPQKQGGIFWEVTPHILYLKSSNSPVKETAQHIDDACHHPEKTVPKINNKLVAGCSPSRPLHRLFYNAKRRVKNRSTAVATCARTWPNYGKSGKDCDEFPFATTYEGAAQSVYEHGVPANMYSARALTSADNQKAGNALGVWYGADRLLDWSWTGGGTVVRDPFDVWIK